MSAVNDNNEKIMLLEFSASEDGYEFSTNMKKALSDAEDELSNIIIKLEESTDS